MTTNKYQSLIVYKDDTVTESYVQDGLYILESRAIIEADLKTLKELNCEIQTIHARGDKVRVYFKQL